VALSIALDVITIVGRSFSIVKRKFSDSEHANGGPVLNEPRSAAVKLALAAPIQ